MVWDDTLKAEVGGPLANQDCMWSSPPPPPPVSGAERPQQISPSPRFSWEQYVHPQPHLCLEVVPSPQGLKDQLSRCP